MVTAAQRLPYPGLRSFRREESDLFFGRESCINAMVDRLASTRFLAVLGSSGIGKSSVAKTGLLDALDLGLMASAGSVWRVVDFKPGGKPLHNLARGLLQAAAAGSDIAHGGADADTALLRAFLRRGPRSIVEWCAAGHLPKDTNLLLLVDQFEELFRYQDYAGREEAEAFAMLLLESVRQREFPVYVALTMRSEYLGACALIDGLAEAISGGLVLIPRMTRDQCRSAIVGPAGVCGFKIEDGLTNRLLNDLAAFAPWDDRGTREQLDRLARRADQLPLLQYCLNRMWMRARDTAGAAPIILTLTDYDRIGGLAGALNAHANEVLGGLGEAHRPIAERVFRALTDGSMASDAVRRPTTFAALAAICSGDEAGVRAVVDAFRSPGCNFLAPQLEPDNPQPLAADTIVDISHESLIRQWRELSQWVEAEARARRQWRRLRDRFEDQQPLQGAELANMVAWRDEEKPNAAWAKRYGGDFAAMMDLIRRSVRRQRRFAPLVLPVLSSALIIIALLCIIGILNLLAVLSPEVAAQLVAPGSLIWPVGFVLAFQCAIAAMTCAFGLWRYGGLRPTRALLASASTFALTFASGYVFVEILSRLGIDAYIGDRWWDVTLAAPSLVSALAIFHRAFRRLSTWSILVFTYVAGAALDFVSNAELNNYWGLLSVVWCIWCIVLGFQMRRLDDDVRLPEQRPWYAGLKLALWGGVLSISGVTASEALSQHLYDVNHSSWSWLIRITVLSTAVAIALVIGLRWYRGFALKQALIGGTIILACECIGGFVLGEALLWRQFGSNQVTAWGLIIAGPCAAAALAIIDRSFRQIWLYALLAVVYAGPWAASVWLNQSGHTNSVVLFLSFLGTLMVWLAAVGYRMNSARLRSGITGNPPALGVRPLVQA